MAIRIRKSPTETSTKAVRRSEIVSADQLLKHLEGIGIETAPIDLPKTLKHFNIGLSYKPMEESISGKLLHNGGKWQITVNSLHHPNRQRFTIAHELGHYFLHRDGSNEFIDKEFFRKNDESNEMEVGANKFAADILMPQEVFVDYVKRESRKIGDVARFFEVSAMAVKYRADQLF